MECSRGNPFHIFNTVGHTPLVHLRNIPRSFGIPDSVRILAKLESSNPTGSVKDRAAMQILKDGIHDGRIKLPTKTSPGTVVVEATSGNTGIALASMCAALGLRMVATMPETMSVERRVALKVFGASVVLTEAAKGMKGAIEAAELIKERLGDGAVIAGQFTNPSNPRAHYLGTGPEILEQTSNALDMFVVGVGTGGTISGAGKKVREVLGSATAIVAVEPSESDVLTHGPTAAGPHGIQGIGAGFTPDVLDLDLVDRVVTVTCQASLEMARRVAAEEGLYVGISAGANVAATMAEVKRCLDSGELGSDATVVTILPDTGERYMGSALFTTVFDEASKLPTLSTSDVEEFVTTLNKE